MKKWIRNIVLASLLTMVAACAGFERGCSDWGATTFGADWIVVQYDLNMNPKLCWKLENKSVANETSSDGIYWNNGLYGDLIHVSGHYNFVQVENNNFAGAAKALGVTANNCVGGRYIE